MIPLAGEDDALVPMETDSGSPAGAPEWGESEPPSLFDDASQDLASSSFDVALDAPALSEPPASDDEVTTAPELAEEEIAGGDAGELELGDEAIVELVNEMDEDELKAALDSSDEDADLFEDPGTDLSE